MTAKPPTTDPAAEAVSALREALARDIEDPIHGRDSRSLALETAEGLILGPLAPLLADIAALRTRADTERKNREQWAMQAHEFAAAADRLAREKDAAEARADALTADNAVLRSVLAASRYLIDRLQACHAGKCVRDLDEATSAYEAARASDTGRSEAEAKEAAAKVCHDEQMTVWSGEVIGRLTEYLRDDLSYDDVLHANDAVAREVRSIVESAFGHPERAALNPPAGQGGTEP